MEQFFVKRLATMRMVATFLGVVLLASCESDEPPVDPMEPLVHPVELPADHGLGSWLAWHQDSSDPYDHSVSFVVVAGEDRVEGGVGFSCPVAGVDCSVTVKFECFDFIALSAGGRASAQNHIVELPDFAWPISYCEPGGLSIPAGEYRDSGEVRFSCPPHGADCEVQFAGSYCIDTYCPELDSGDGGILKGLCVDRAPGAYSVGGTASAGLVPPGAPPPSP